MVAVVDSTLSNVPFLYLGHVLCFQVKPNISNGICTLYKFYEIWVKRDFTQKSTFKASITFPKVAFLQFKQRQGCAIIRERKESDRLRSDWFPGLWHSPLWKGAMDMSKDWTGLRCLQRHLECRWWCMQERFLKDEKRHVNTSLFM